MSFDADIECCECLCVCKTESESELTLTPKKYDIKVS